MQYVRSISGSVSKTWNSINPATLSGAIDVIVVEQEDGTLSCSPFHVRFGKFSLLRPSDKKVEFKVNNVKQDYAMKLGEGGEAFFVFETSADVPDNLKTSPLVSAASSPAQSMSTSLIPDAAAQEPEPLSLDDAAKAADPTKPHHGSLTPMLIPQRHVQTDLGPDASLLSQSFPHELQTMSSTSLPEHEASGIPGMSGFVDDLSGRRLSSFVRAESANIDERPKSSPSNSIHSDAVSRAMALSKKLWSSNIASQVTDTGDLMLDMTGYKSTEEGVIQAELVARKILAEEVEGVTDIGSLISPDEKGNLWIYSSEEAKLAATRKMAMAGLNPVALLSSDALSDPGYHSSDDMESQKSGETSDRRRERAESESVTTLTTPPLSPNPMAVDSGRSYAKTLRLTSDQLRALDLKPGPNTMSFSVNRATCQAYMFLWKQNVPIVISDIDGTITKSDALGHVLNMIGRDWTHLGVAKLYSDIVLNGYNILYLTSRSVGQADTTRAYIAGIVQEGHRLPKGPVILSPDRTMAALRREIYLRQPEVFKMACLRDIMSLFNQRESPFYAGFGNRLTDALSYRSVNIPSTRIFTINSNAEVSLDLMSLNKYKTGYSSMREIVDHYFPPIGMLVQEGGEEYTDFNYWRDKPLDVDDISETDSDGGGALTTIMSEDYGDDDVFSDDLNESYISRDSMDDSLGSMVRPSIEADRSGRLARLSSHDTLAEESEEDEEGDDIDELDLVAAAAADRSSSARRSSRSSNLESLHRESSHNRPNRSGSTSSTTAHARRASTSSRK